MKKQKRKSIELKKLTIAKISAEEMNTVKGEAAGITGPLADYLVSWFRICV